MDRFELVDGSYQHNLLRDRARLGGYAEAIAKVVRPGDIVADLGSGSGILAWLALRAGAARVHAVEANRGSFAQLQRLLARNGVADRVQATHADAERWVPPEPVDVALCELMETGLLHEPVAAVVRAVHAWPSRPRAIVPARVRLLVEGVRLDDTFHGYRAPLPGFRAASSGEPATDAACYLDLDFQARPPPEGVDSRFALHARARGRIDALRLRTDSMLAPGVEVGPSAAYCVPVVLPLPEPMEVEASESLHGALQYAFDFVPEPVRFELVPE